MCIKIVTRVALMLYIMAISVSSMAMASDFGFESVNDGLYGFEFEINSDLYGFGSESFDALVHTAKQLSETLDLSSLDSINGFLNDLGLSEVSFIEPRIPIQCCDSRVIQTTVQIVEPWPGAPWRVYIEELCIFCGWSRTTVG